MHIPKLVRQESSTTLHSSPTIIDFVIAIFNKIYYLKKLSI